MDQFWGAFSVTLQSHNGLIGWYFLQRRPIGEAIIPESLTEYYLSLLIIECEAVVLESVDFHADESDLFGCVDIDCLNVDLRVIIYGGLIEWCLFPIHEMKQEANQVSIPMGFVGKAR